MQINDLVKKAHENAVNKGFWDEEPSFGEQIALMHSELSEALEEYRRGHKENYLYSSTCHTGCESLTAQCNTCPDAKPEGIPIELADTVIRIFDTCGKYGIDLEHAIEIKMKHNEGRPRKHGKVI